MSGPWFEPIRTWLAVGRNRGIVIGIVVVLAAVGAGLPSVLGGSGSGPSKLSVGQNTPTPGVTAGTTTPGVTPKAGQHGGKGKSPHGGKSGPRTSATPSIDGPGGATRTPFKKTDDGDTTISTGDGNGIDNGGNGNNNQYDNLAMGKGVSKTAISLGVAYEVNQAAYGSAYGLSLSNVDEKKQAQGIINYINGHGGVAGRKIAPVWHAVDLAASLHGSNETQKTCDAFTQDATVFGAVGTVQSQCILEHHVVQINEASGEDSQYGQYADYSYSPSAFSEDRALHALTQGLGADNFFAKMPANPGCDDNNTPKLGAIVFDSDKDRQQPKVVAALDDVGESVDQWGYVDNTSSNVQQIVLAFKQGCVTHVITPGYSPLLFANAAESQQYRPLYGVSSFQTPSLLAKNVNKNQLVNFHAVGWSPAADTDDAHDPGSLGADANLCVTIMKDQGLPTTRSDMQSANSLCDELFVLKVTLDHAKALTAHGFRLAYEAIGSWDSCVTFQVSLSAAHHAGATGFRVLHYSATAKTFIYVSAVKTLA
jgi:hypothetical protein